MSIFQLLAHSINDIRRYLSLPGGFRSRMETNPSPTNFNFIQWVIEILIPYLALLLGLVLLRTWRRQQKFASKPEYQAARYEDKLETAYDIGYEACVLGFGMAVLLLGSSEFQLILKTERALVMPFVVGIPIIAALLFLGTSSYSGFLKAVVSIIAGTLVFGILTAMMTWVREHQSLALTVVLGVIAWGLPCAGFIALVVKFKRDHANAEARTARQEGGAGVARKNQKQGPA